MELNSNLIIVIVAIFACVMALTYAVLSVQNSLGIIVKFLEEERLNKQKAEQNLSPDVIPEAPKVLTESKFRQFRKMIIPAALLVLAFGINNIDKIIDFISPDPFEETNKKLAMIAEQIQPSVKIELPDSIEQRDDVKQIRSMQDKIMYFNLNFRFLQEASNSTEDFNADADTMIVNYYQSLLVDFQKVNHAFGQIVQGIIAMPTVYAYLNKNDLIEYLKIQEKYGQTETETLEALQPMADDKEKAKNMKKFKSIMSKLVDESFIQADRQIELAKRIDIALNLALLDIKTNAISNSDSPLHSLLLLLGGLDKN